LSRGFFAQDVLKPNSIVLDIGCGDGFFSARFSAPRCRHVDAIVVEPTAVAFARRHHHVRNVTYHLADATADSFPRDRYDVIVWDGAIGHFAPESATGV
jgi:protein-L-isoaspartate O-methyltransferase